MLSLPNKNKKKRTNYSHLHWTSEETNTSESRWWHIITENQVPIPQFQLRAVSTSPFQTHTKKHSRCQLRQSPMPSIHVHCSKHLQNYTNVLFPQHHDKACHNIELGPPFNWHTDYKTSQAALMHFNMRTLPKASHIERHHSVSWACYGL